MSTYNQVPHPGFFIKEELEARGWLQRDLAYILGIADQAVSAILSGKVGISSDMAKSLGDAFDVSAEFFLNLQKKYELYKTNEPDPNIARRANLQSQFPIREMIRRGWFVDTDISLLEEQIIRFFEIESANDAPNDIAHAAKKADPKTTTPAQLAWLYRANQIAKTMVVPRYSEKKLRKSLNRLEELMTEPEEIRHIPNILSECGVRYVIVEKLPNAKIDGVCFWLNKTSPVIGMSTSHDRIDNFWFVLRHEIEHVLQKDGQSQAVIDAELKGEAAGTGPAVSEQERTANAAAADFCAPSGKIDSFIARKKPYFSERDILGLADRLQRHPGIVIGQIQHKTGRYDLLRKHLINIRQYILPTAMVDGWGDVAPVLL